jgi:hypothetical protein
VAKIDQKYTDIADRMISAERDLKKAQRAYERMSRLSYELPSPLREWEWIHPVISTAPYDALRGAVRALSNLDEGIDIHPITVHKAIEDPDSKAAAELANTWEKALKWELGKSHGRRKDLREDIVWSSALYDMCVGQLIHVPTQMGLTGALPSRTKAALRHGDWALQMLDVKTVYVEWSSFTYERVLIVSVKTAKEILDFWGDKASFVEREISKGGSKERHKREADLWVEYDLVGHDDGRVVWASEGPAPDMKKEGHIIIGPEPWLKDVKTGEQVPFLPIIISAGGTSIDYAPEHQFKPLLYPVYRAEQWATTNLAATIMMSQQIAAASSATDVYTGPGAEDIEEDWTGPRRRLDLNIGQTYQQIKDADMDTGLREVFDRLEGAIQRATVSDVLVTAQPLSGEQAFAAYNLQVQQALASLGGIRSTGQSFLQKVYETMLLIAYYTGIDIKGYGDGLEEYIIKSEDIDPDAIQIKVELRADVPADRVQRVTSAAQMAGTMQYPMKRILKMLGETDPEGAIEEWELEQMETTYLQAKLQNMSRYISGEFEEAVMMAAQQLVEGQMAQLQGEAQGEGQPGAIPGGEFNPQQGGPPAAMASPEGATFEGSRGRPRGSNQPIPAIGEQGIGP